MGGSKTRKNHSMCRFRSIMETPYIEIPSPFELDFLVSSDLPFPDAEHLDFCALYMGQFLGPEPRFTTPTQPVPIDDGGVEGMGVTVKIGRMRQLG